MARSRIVVLTLEVTVLDHVAHGVTGLHAPLGLQGQVGHTHGVDRQAVAVDEDALVGCHGVAVGVVESVGVVERAAVGRIGDALVAVVRGGAIVKAQLRRGDVTLKAHLVSRYGKRIERLAGVVGLRTHLHGVSILAGIEAVECHLFIVSSCVCGILGDVLHFKGTACGCEVHIGAHVTATENHLACVPGQSGQVGHLDCCLAGVGLDGCRRNGKTMRHTYCNVIDQVGRVDGECLSSASAVKRKAVS